ncbi:MAG: hypothetical protein LBJ86_04575 [Spirochaetaceae bacterium]|jgi:hypothetical protein|nr:hypothetical protein [Spirochaetaceae bacterium]
MKRFILNIVKFAFVSAAAVLAVVGGTYLILDSASFKLPPEKNILVISDSTGENAINSDAFYQSVNLSRAATTYLYSYLKLKRFLRENPHIDTVLLGFNAPVLGRAGDEFTFSIGWSIRQIPYYCVLLDKESIAVLYKNKAPVVLSLLRIPVKNIRPLLKFMLKRKLDYNDLEMGPVLAFFGTGESGALERNVEEWEKNPKTEDDYISPVQLDYLQKIVTLCEESGVKLFLFTTPYYKSEVYGETARQKLLRYHETYLPETAWLDFTNFPLPDSGFRTFSYLSASGAEVFSRHLAQIFADGLTID